MKFTCSNLSLSWNLIFADALTGYTWILCLHLLVFDIAVLVCCTFCQGSHKPVIVLYALKTLGIGSWFLKKQEKKSMWTRRHYKAFFCVVIPYYECVPPQRADIFFFLHSIARFHWSLSSNFQPDPASDPRFEQATQSRCELNLMWTEHEQNTTWLHSDLPFHQSVLLYIYLIAQRRLGLVIVHI